MGNDVLSKLSPGPLRWLASCLLVALVGLAIPRTAPAQPSGNKPRLVVLNVPKGGSQRLSSEFRTANRFDVKGQGWFVEQIRNLGVNPQGIMSNQDKLERVMVGANIDYILYLVPTDGSYEARFIEHGSSNPTFTTRAPMGSNGLSRSAAKSLRDEIVAYIKSQQPKPEPEPEPTPKADRTPKDDGKDADKAKDQKDGEAADNWLWAAARFRLIKRDLTIAGSNNSVVIYTSTFYPGFELDFEVYPLSLTDTPALASVGLLVDFIQGFESIPFKDESGNQKTISVSQTEFEAGPIFRLRPQTEGENPLARRRVRLKTTVRHSNYSVGANPKLPSTSLTSIIVGARLAQPLLFDGFAVEADLELIPIAFFGKGGDLFGRSSTTHGFSTRLGLMYAFSDGWRIGGGYRFRLHHTRFVGKGTSNFINSEGFELVQGVDLGLQYRY